MTKQGLPSVQQQFAPTPATRSRRPATAPQCTGTTTLDSLNKPPNRLRLSTRPQIRENGECVEAQGGQRCAESGRRSPCEAAESAGTCTPRWCTIVMVASRTVCGGSACSVWRIAGCAPGHGRDSPAWVDLRGALHTTERPPHEHQTCLRSALR